MWKHYIQKMEKKLFSYLSKGVHENFHISRFHFVSMRLG